MRCWLFGHRWYETYPIPSKYEVRLCERCGRKEWWDGEWWLELDDLQALLGGYRSAEERRLSESRHGERR